MSQNRIMLSMNRRRLLWWGRILPLVVFAYTILSFLIAVIWDEILGVGSIPLWLIFLNRDVTIFLIWLCPILLLISIHPFGEMASGLSKKNVVSAKVSYGFMFLAVIIYLVTITFVSPVSIFVIPLLYAFLYAFSNYEKSSNWELNKHWSLKFPPEEYPPFSKQEKAQFENGGIADAS